ncbi:hypothetical protein CQW23_12739 [Capsicum baccatum]|uniref:NB-ARC domain-containing protein n=1 Tax=Capsicum baccatum TaxID=33114 RepID=A0A2G2WTL8_CAPBA|nr:hypothetical protein CQW23_12739 [Capsicum baccatum]
MIWVRVPKPIDIRKVQAQIASRLNLKVDNEGSVESIASIICDRLKEEKSFFFILDNVWDGINLDDVGVPQPIVPSRSKVIIATHSLEVCRQMRTEIEVNVTTLKEDESWQLFLKSAGDSAKLEHIQPWARDIAKECGGLPLAIVIIGTSMRGKTKNVDCLKMHDVVRDVAIWIANSSRNEHKSIIQIGIGLTTISHIKVSVFVKTISFIRNEIECLPNCFTKCPETTSLLLQDNEFLEEIPYEFFLAFPALRVLNLSGTGIGALPSSIDSLCQLRALILQSCHWLKELPPIGNLCNLKVLDCDHTMLHCLPEGLDKFTNLRLLNLPAYHLKSIGKRSFLKLSNIEMLNMLESKRYNTKYLVRDITFILLRAHLKGSLLGPTSFDELSSLHNLTTLFIRLDNSSIFNRYHT